MLRLSRYFIRASLIYLLLGLTAGALILANKGIPFAPLVWVLLPLHIETMFVGWMSQLASCILDFAQVRRSCAAWGRTLELGRFGIDQSRPDRCDGCAV